MDVIESHIDVSSKEYKANYEHYEELVNDFKGKIAVAAKGGGDEKIKLHKSRNKMLVRERIDALCMIIEHPAQVWSLVLVSFMVKKL